MGKIECSGCGRRGPFEFVGRGEVEFIDLRATALDLSNYEQIEYRPPSDDFQPPEGHLKSGSDKYTCENGNVSAIPDSAEVLSAIHTSTMDTHQAEQDLPTWEKVKRLFESDENGSTTEAYNKAAKIINFHNHIVTIRKSGHVYFYEPQLGYYVLKGETYINEKVNQNLGEKANENRRREIRQRVIEENYIDRSDFTPPDDRVCVENGVLNLETLEREPWSPEYYFTSRIQAKWPVDGEADPWAEAWWFRALKEAHQDENEQEKILRWIGYALESWHHDLEQNLFFVGYRRSGKSTIQEAIQELFGSPPTVVNISPQQLADTQFDAGQLRDAALNTVNDINATKIENSGMLKRVFSGEAIKMEDKHKDPEFGEPKAKHLFTANWLPRVSGSDEALFRRIMIVEFLNKKSKAERDPEYKKRLKKDDVLQAILVSAARARLRLRTDREGDPKGHFPADRDAGETRKVWDSWRDPHKRFLYLQFEITANPDDTVERQSYWEAAHQFATRNGWKPTSPNGITRALQYVPGVYAQGSGDTYGGLRWKDVDAADLVGRGFDDGPGGNEADGSADHQARLAVSQSRRIQLVEQTVDDLDSGDGAPREKVLERLVGKGVSEELAQDEIEGLLSNGTLTRAGNGRVYLT